MPTWLRLLVGLPVAASATAWLWYCVGTAALRGVARTAARPVRRRDRPWYFWAVVAAQATFAACFTWAVVRLIRPLF